MFDIEKLIAANDLVSLSERAGAKFIRVGYEMRSHCPLHGGNDPTAFAVYKSDGKQMWKCFSGVCGGGDLIEFVEVWQHIDFRGACEFLGGDVISDPVAMERSARDRHEAAEKRAQDAQLEVEARRQELQREELHLLYHHNLTAKTRRLWEQRGIDESWQNFWYLGYRSDYAFSTPMGMWHTPTMTIPIFDDRRELLNIKHRLINPCKPNDKYRPERPGLGSMPPFLAIPEQGWDGEVIIVTEGEIKAMVLCTLDLPLWQFVGTPGRNGYAQIVNNLKGKPTVFIPDPNAEPEARAAAKLCGARLIEFPDKVDDYVMANHLDGDWLRNSVKSARVVR